MESQHYETDYDSGFCDEDCLKEDVLDEESNGVGYEYD